MYDATINARVSGKWIMVVSPGAGEEKVRTLEETPSLQDIKAPQTDSLGIEDDQAYNYPKRSWKLGLFQRHPGT
jgi:hypothetical protein